MRVHVADDARRHRAPAELGVQRRLGRAVLRRLIPGPPAVLDAGLDHVARRVDDRDPDVVAGLLQPLHELVRVRPRWRACRRGSGSPARAIARLVACIGQQPGLAWTSVASSRGYTFSPSPGGNSSVS